MTNKSFCPAPWNSFFINPAGAVENCCVSQNKLGNINDVPDIKKIIFADKNLKIQQDMLDGKTIEGCKWCHDTTHSLQKRFFDIFKDADTNPLYTAPGQFELGYMDLRWHNTCNLACMYCSPTLSSTWADELKQYHKIERDNKSDLMTYVLDNIHTLKELYLAGGEPLMLKENEIVLRALLDKNPDCHVLINTNLTQIKNNKIFELATSMEHCSWLVSIDAIEDKFEYIRYPAVWSEFAENLQTLKGLVGPDRVAFNMVCMNVNADTVWDAVDYLLDEGFSNKTITIALYNNGTYPGPWDVKYLTNDLRKATLARMDQNKYKHMLGWQNIWDYITNLGDTEYIKELDESTLKNLDILDTRRKLDSRQVFPLVYTKQG
jgi:MoaA/NifB/PqqE/SkfB family radical SAM enzyme